MNGFLFELELADVVVEVVEFDLLALDFLIVIGQLLLPLVLVSFDLGELVLGIEEVVFPLAKRLLRDPSLPLLVSLLVHEVLELRTLMVHLLLHLTVSTSDSVDLLLEYLAFVGLILNVALHLVDLRLALADLILDFLRFLLEVLHGALLELDFSLGFADLILQAV